jgi:hypothetical protein
MTDSLCVSAPEWKDDRAWSCIKKFDNLTLDDLYGCGTGCANCEDSPSNLISGNHDLRGGVRFMQPSVFPPNRDAGGFIRDLASGRFEDDNPTNDTWLRVPQTIAYERAPCYQNYGIGGAPDSKECFYRGPLSQSRGQCSCWPQSHKEPSPRTDCTYGEAVNSPLRGYLHDCQGFTNSAKIIVDCREVGEPGNTRVVMGGEKLFNMTSHRTGGCVSNMLITCGGRSLPTQCPDAYETDDGQSTRHFFYWHTAGEGPKWPSFVRLANSTRLRATGNAVVDAKNAVLRAVAQNTFNHRRDDGSLVNVNFQQLDYVAHEPNGWFSADYWRRDAVGDGLAKSFLPVVYSYPRSYLRQTRCAVTAELRIRSIAFELSLIALNRRFRPGSKVTYPHGRVRIRAECVVTAALVDGANSCTLDRPWLGDKVPPLTVTIDNAGSGHYPVVSPGFEDIVFVDGQGRESDPPVMVEWWGMLGSFSTPKTVNVWTPGSLGTMDGQCGRLREVLSGVRIPAWPYGSESLPDDPNQVYAGDVELSFA